MRRGARPEEEAMAEAGDGLDGDEGDRASFSAFIPTSAITIRLLAQSSHVKWGKDKSTKGPESGTRGMRGSTQS